MTLKRLLKHICLIIVVTIIMGGFSSYTYTVDTFSDDNNKWIPYNSAIKLRDAKIEYLDENHGSYNSYIVGSLGSGHIPISTLNKYSKQKYFDLSDQDDTILGSLNTVKYIVENYEVKEILLPISLRSALSHNNKGSSLNHIEEEDSRLSILANYLFANLTSERDETSSEKKDSDLQQSNNVFNSHTGEYDRSINDVEYIGDIESYLEEFPGFKDFNSKIKKMNNLDELMDTIVHIKKICDDKDIKLNIIMTPMYIDELDTYSQKDIDLFFQKLGDIINYWDFTDSSVSNDPRYFYDINHHRNSVGEMILNMIYNKPKAYIPDDFGEFIDEDWVKTDNESVEDIEVIESPIYETNIPILMFHHIAEKVSNNAIVSESKFKHIMKYLKDNDYNTVTFKDLNNYVINGKELPHNPIMITVDDGYLSNYEIMFPILKENDQKATIFVIGSSVGKYLYKETNHQITPHFTIEQMVEMGRSKVIDIGSHSYDMHQSKDLEEPSSKIRLNALKLEEETEEEYIQFFSDDFDKFNRLYKEINGGFVQTFAYPLGIKDVYSEALLSDMGIKATFTVEEGNNTIVKGLPQSLFSLKRNNVSQNTDIAKLLKGLNIDK